MQARERLAQIRVRGPARPRWTYAQDLGQRTVGFKLSIHVARSAAQRRRLETWILPVVSQTMLARGFNSSTARPFDGRCSLSIALQDAKL
jgi:5-carboxymethyl-2-hydroxymuconate isomerase